MKRLLIIIILFNCYFGFSQNALDNIGLTISTPSTVAYSTRLLSSSYSGYALKVRRSSDNSTQDIGFTGSGDLDTATLKTFIGSSDCFVQIWYDQSGNNNNLTQNTNVNQPKLAASGSIYRENGKPFIRFFGVPGGLKNSLNLAADMTTNGHVIIVNKFATGGRGFLLGHNSSYYWHSENGSALFAPYASSSIINGSIWQNGLALSATAAVSNEVLMINSVAPQSPSTNTTWNNIGVDRNFWHTSLGGGFSEIITFSTALSTLNRTTIDANQAAYYSITLVTRNNLDNIGLNSSDLAESAYSIRKLSSTYSGNAIQVRRSSDNTTQDIGFTGSGDLDTTSLKSFVGANNGFVTIWYDQSGIGRNLIQASTGSQPKIVNSGSIYRRNGRPTIYHDNTDDGLIYNYNYITTNPLTVNIVAGSNSNSSGFRRAVQGSNNWLIGPYENKNSWYAGDWNTRTDAPWSINEVEIFTVIQPSSNPNLSYRNGTSQTCSNNKGVPNRINTGAKGGYSEPLDGFISEIIVFSKDLSSNHTTIEANQGSYFLIAISTSLNKNGKFSLTPAEYVSRNGAIGSASILRTGQTTSGSLPNVTSTESATLITATTAESGGIISNDGGSPIIGGVCWSTSSNPTIALSTKTTTVSAVGSFSSSITGLIGSTTYYVRAYATNSTGTTYGNEISFTTEPAVPPTLALTSISSSFNFTTEIIDGEVTSDGGGTITSRGICWSTSSNPTISDFTSTVGGTTGTFTSNATGLSNGITYYARAFATNIAGTSYGNEVTFTTEIGIGDPYEGGIIAYVFLNGDPGYIPGEFHGLIAATNDQSNSIIWSNNYNSNSTSNSIGSGNDNTINIVNNEGGGSYAAQICYDLDENGYNDWYLPSYDELNKLYENKDYIGGFSNDYYWSSTEDWDFYAYIQHFGGGWQYSDDKNMNYYVRAVRSF